jgi:heterodisulfide reductase subunit C2
LETAVSVNVENVEKTDYCEPLSCSSKIDPQLKEKIKELCGENVMSCYQCGECTAGCPAAFAMDIAPNRVMRMAQMGLSDELLSSSAIWLCAGCETCSTRCPRGVALSKVMDACRQLSVKEGKAAENNIVTFHKEFLNEVQRNGRVWELALMGVYKTKTRDFFSDVFQGIQMFLKGKLGLIPSRIKGREELRKLFKK